MNKKNLFIVMGLFVFLWFVMSGQYINNNPNVSGIIFVYGLIDLAIMSLIMMITPIIFIFIYKRKLDLYIGKKILKWNILGTLVFLMIKDIIVFGGIYDEVFQCLGANLVYAFVFYIINKKIFISDKIKVNIEIVDEKIEENVVVKIKNEKNGTTYCKICGGKLNESKKCKKCGKQYFYIKPIKAKNIIVILILSISLLISIGFNIYQSISLQNNQNDNSNEIKRLKAEIIDLEDDNFDLRMKSFEYEEKANFLDENIVLIIEGYGDYYYTYDCAEEITGGDYSFWAYNKEAAISRRYEKGTCD